MPTQTGAGSIGIGIGIGPSEGGGGTVSPPPPPPATGPTACLATAQSPTSILVVWTAAQDTETSHVVERSDVGAGGPFTQIADVAPATTEEYLDSTVSDNTQYWYRVAGKNAGGLSPYSNVDDATTPNVPSQVPAAPSDLQATANGTTIDLTWTDNSGAADDQEDTFHIERSLDGSTGWAEIGTVAQDVTTYQDAGLDESTEYFYRVRGQNAVGFGGYSNTANATTGSGLLDPLQIFGAALEFWGESVKQGGTGLLAQVTDFSANANDATQSTQASQPLIETGADGNPEWIFDGVDDFLVLGTPIDLGAGDMHLWFLVEPTASGGAASRTTIGNSTTATNGQFRTITSFANYQWHASGDSLTAFGIPISGQYVAIRASRVSGTAEVYQDGVQSGTGGALIGNMIWNTISENDFGLYMGAIRLVVAVQGTITAQQITDMDAYVDSLMAGP